MFINSNIRVKIDEESRTLWVGIDLKDKLYYSIDFLENLSCVRDLIVYIIRKEQIRYVVAYSVNPGVWNMGGDLEFFVHCIRNKKRTDLQDYAYKCIDLVYQFNNNYETDVFSACVVQGNAFGGGFESALSGNFILAEESAKFSFPEMIFGTFPGMGAYSILTKKIGYRKASEMIQSNKTFTAREICEMGIIDRVCENGTGLLQMATLIHRGELEKYRQDRFLNICNRVTRSELLEIVNLWLDRAFSLGEENLSRMMKISGFQKRKLAQEKAVSPQKEMNERLEQINELINKSFE
ncbi:MAG TPA: crotonase/enoyl-CoA hydratase family protein [Chitinophagaceae bacterium]|nr:crotonase/enoyl-CoA hydratase family protein [Chitinophagaceae bacterium]